jgi:hypothetical protein
MLSKRVLILFSLIVLDLALLAAGEWYLQAGERELVSLAGSTRHVMAATSCPESFQALPDAEKAVQEAL